jgi:tetrahydromethanopterin S-methyltransferase subunit B
VKLSLRPDPEGLVGQTGRALTDLKPQGRVQVQGFEYNAHTSGVFYEAGAEVVVVDVDHLGLVVRVPTDAHALDALVGAPRPRRTPRRYWWGREEVAGPEGDTAGLWAAWVTVVIMVILGLALLGWLLVWALGS